MKPFFYLLLVFVILSKVQTIHSQTSKFNHEVASKNKPWTQKSFNDNPDNFQFAIVSDRTGGHRKGVFGKAIKKLNLLMPEFVMSVGDLIEGYTKINDTINSEWKEFDGLVSPLKMKFFALPGNHDISNEVMRKKWIERYGTAYYHFLYKDVLFLALDTNDGDGSAVLSKKQINYFKKAIENNKNVRWVLVFMHHPVWLYEGFSTFKELEKILPKNKYTVFAGHNHQYLQQSRNESNYYVLATTGGGSALRGPNFGEFDHVTWITMTDKGPKMLNLRLNGMIEHDIVTPEMYEKRKSLINATDFNAITTYNEDKTGGKIHFGIQNTSNDTIFFNGNLFHNHHLKFNTNKISMKIPPKSFKKEVINWKLSEKAFFGRFNPVELYFTIGYPTNKIDNPFQIQGNYTIPKTVQKKNIKFSEPTIFADKSTISLHTNNKELIVKYTLDGSIPNRNSKTYTKPISVEKSTTIKASLFDADLENKTGSLEKTYTKAKLLNSVNTSSTKNGISYKYYEGNFTQLPKFETLQVVRSGITQDFDVEKIANERLDHYAIKYEGYIDAPKDGLYTFYTKSDDGSKLYIHDKLVVDNGGSHSKRTKKGYINLKKGKHPIKIVYFEDYSEQTLSVFWKLPNTNKKEEVNFKYFFH